MFSDFIDICIVCALPEELAAVRKVFHRRSGEKFVPATSQETGRDYLRGIAYGREGSPFTVHLSCPPRYEGIELALHLKPILSEFKPRIAAMTGICAGDKDDTYLGDIIVAESAFQYDTGKFILDERNRKVHRPDTRTFHPEQNLLQFARTFTGWKQSINRMRRPRSLHAQEDWLLNRLIKSPHIAVGELPLDELNENAPNWKLIVQRLRGKKDDQILDGKLRLINDDTILSSRTNAATFPFIDSEIRCLVKPMASGNAVRADGPFEEVRRPVRTAIAIDMEGAAFYRTVADFPGIASILIKGVCDFADPYKDDTYHTFAAEASANYLYSFLYAYMTTDRPPRLFPNTPSIIRNSDPSRQEALEIINRLYHAKNSDTQTTTIDNQSRILVNSPDSRPRPWHNLPNRNYTKFIGRSDELQKLAKLLSRFFYATIDGIGGVGKSTLALEFAYRELEHYLTLNPNERFEAVVWVSAKRTILTEYGIRQHKPSFNTTDDLFREIAIVLQQPDILKRDLEQQKGLIIQALRDHRTLIILDNLETADDEEILSFIRDDLPEPTKVIITSRHRVDAVGQILLTGMPIEDASDLILMEAVRKDVELSPEQVEDLYKHAGGVPLAIVWSIGLMSLGYEVDTVLRRLSNGRSDISQFCFTESVKRIRETEAYRLLLALAIFDTSVNSDMLGEVAGLSNDKIGRDQRDGALIDLLQLSLCIKDHGRFRLLPLTRFFVLDEYNAQPELERDIRQNWIKCLVELANPFNDHRWFYRPRSYLRQEGAHLVTLGAWCQREQQPDVFLAILPALREYYDLEGLWAERIKVSQIGLVYAQLVNDQKSEISTKVSLAWILSQQGDYKQSKRLITQAIDLAEAIKDYRWLCEALITHAIVLRRLSENEEAVMVCRRAMQLLQELPASDRAYVEAWIDYELGLNARDVADWETAEQHFLSARNVLRIDEDNPVFNIEFAWVLHTNLGFIKQQMGDLDGAEEIYLPAVEFFREVGSKGQVVTLLTRLAILEEQRGRDDSALLYAREALEWAKRLSMPKAIRDSQGVLTRLSS